jgi:hypothetical protein
MSENVQATLNERENSHGDFIENGRVMQLFKAICRNEVNWELLSPYQKESIDMICNKLGRILCGNPNHIDHWHDIAGYATLVENILSTGKSHPTK